MIFYELLYSMHIGDFLIMQYGFLFISLSKKTIVSRACNGFNGAWHGAEPQRLLK